jgi:hypothetical protein
MRWVIVDDFNIRGQTNAGVRALDKVVAKQGIARKPAIQNRVQRIDLVNTLAGKDALAKQVLVGV